MSNQSTIMFYMTIEYYLKVMRFGKEDETFILQIKASLVDFISRMLVQENIDSEIIFDLLQIIPRNDMAMRDTLVMHLFHKCLDAAELVLVAKEISTSRDTHVRKEEKIVARIAQIMKTVPEGRLDFIIDHDFSLSLRDGERIRKFLLSCRQ